MSIDCERFFVATVMETRYDPAAGVGSPTWQEEVVINSWQGRVRATPEVSASAANTPNEHYTPDENRERMEQMLADRLAGIVPGTTPADLNWVDVPPWQASRG